MTRSVARGLAALVVLLTCQQTLRLVTRPGDFRDSEEAYNAAVGYVMWTAGLWDQALPLQNADFCGGCSVVALLAAPVLGLGGDHFLLWKAMAVAWQIATLVVGFFAVDRWAGRHAAATFAVLLAVPLPGLAAMSLMLWGNHQETSLLVLASLLVLPSSTLAAALIAGLSVWFCRTAAYGALVSLPAALLVHRRPGPLVLGAAAGASLLLLPAAAGSNLGYRMSLADNLLPHGVLGALSRGIGLFDPMRLGEPLYGVTPLAPLWAAILILAAVGGVVVSVAESDRGPRRLVFVALPVAFVTLWSVSGFEPGRASVLSNARYYAPWMLLLLLSVATGFGPWLGRDGWRPSLARAAIAAPLLANLLGLGASVLTRRLDRSVTEMVATDLAKFTLVAPARLDAARVRQASAADPRVERALRRIEGYQLGKTVPTALSRDAAAAGARGEEGLVGLGMALAEPPVNADLAGLNRWLAGLPAAQATAIGRGIARTLLDPGGPDPAPTASAEVARLSAGAQAGGCPLCAAAGLVLLDGCLQPERPPVFQTRGREQPEAGASPTTRVAACLAADATPEVMLGVGWVFSLRSNPDRAHPIADNLPRDLRSAFEAGLGDPVVAVRRVSRGSRSRPSPSSNPR